MKRNIDILIEIQRRIYKFKFTEDDIAVAIDVNDAELFDLINLVILNITIHKLIHSTREETIKRLLKLLNLTERQVEKVNQLRALCELNPVTKF